MINNIMDISFENKIVSFSTENDTLAMLDPSFKTIQKKLFVVGIVPSNATTNDWAKGKICAISWDYITDFIIFDSEKEYKILLEKSLNE